MNGSRLPQHIRGRDLTSASLQGVDGHGTIFERVVGTATLFDNANLKNAAFIRCELPNSTFVAASMNRVVADDADFTGANFLHADLSGALLDRNVTLEDAIFDHAIMDGATISMASHASLRNATGNHMRFGSAVLIGANFTNANLAGSDFTGAIVRDADFTNADLDAVTITPGQLATTKGWATARNLDPGLITETLAILEARGLGR